MRNLHDLLASKNHLWDLATICNDLTSALDQRGFLQSQLHERKHSVWMAMSGETLQARDRAASYSVSDQNAELARLDAEIGILTVEKQFVERLLNDQHAATATIYNH